MQGRFASEHKLAPDLETHLSNLEEEGAAFVTLSVSFPLLHGSREGGSAPLDGHDPAKAAELEWPVELQNAGLRALVRRKTPNLIVLTTNITEVQVGWRSNFNLRILTAKIELFLLMLEKLQSVYISTLTIQAPSLLSHRPVFCASQLSFWSQRSSCKASLL